ncbi:SPASM domain-containing protein [Candidatus Desantisbacteria bacterium]|nr:SPASM domain-containing protein [Candidatus Desantisbacteria bacterium]MBI4846225.1 SPASM domain-containing protein [Candidatus Omnitrophota bacterium]
MSFLLFGLKRKKIRSLAKKLIRSSIGTIDGKAGNYKVIELLHRGLILSNAYKKDDLFSSIQIQTKTGCNYSCRFCPANKDLVNLYGGESNYAKMSIELFEDIICQLSKMKFSGRISPYLMNEPLLDGRLPRFVAITKNKCPNAFIFIQTNGKLLNKKMLVELVDAGIDEIYVNDYTENGIILKLLINMDIPRRYRERLTLEKRSLDEKLTNRAGNIFVSNKIYNVPCLKPFKQMFITFNGIAVLCCQDWQFLQQMGDVKKGSLMSIWNNHAYKMIRNNLGKSQRAFNVLCSRCDSSGLW